MSQIGLGVVAAGLLGVLATACSIRVPESEVYGVYVAQYESGTETLTLEKSGRYVQEVSVKGSAPVVNTGVWKYRPGESVQGRVDLADCLGVNDGFGKIKPDFAVNRGLCSFGIERRFLVIGSLRLGPDESAPLRKVK